MNVLLVSTADWDRPLWTNKQHMATALASDHQVTYVDGIHLRRPRLALADVRRVVSKVAGNRIRLAVDVVPPESVTVVGAGLAPFHGRRSPFAWWNRRRIRSAAADWLASPRESRVLWTFSPTTYGLEREADIVIYHSVDLLHEYPGVDARAFLNAEKALAQEPGLVAIASSAGVYRHLVETGFVNVQLWENVADTEFIDRALLDNVDTKPGAVVFAGNLISEKVDIASLEAVAKLPGVHLHLAGPIGEGGKGVEGRSWAELQRRASVTYHGVLGRDELARLFVQMDVGIVPYRETRYSAGVFPLKVYEYLAAGLGVVVSGVQSVHPISGDLVVSDSRHFAEDVAALCGSSAPLRERRRGAALGHSWASRRVQALDLIHELQGRRRPSL